MGGDPARGGNEPAKVEFNRDVRPILSDNCFFCHGPDKNHRKADLRLDIRADAIEARPSSRESRRRVRWSNGSDSDDADEQMPPPKSNKKLTGRQKEILKRWIEQGAEYQQHWAYERPVKADDPRRAERRGCAGAAKARGDRAEALARGRPPHLDPPS